MNDLEKDQQQDELSALHLQDLSHYRESSHYTQSQSQSQSRFDTQYYQKRSVPFRSVELHFPTFLEHSEYTSLGQFDSNNDVNDNVNSQSSSLLLNSDYINAHFAEALSRSVPLPNIIEEDEGNEDNEDNDDDNEDNEDSEGNEDVFV